jgi:hypothetical protein
MNKRHVFYVGLLLLAALALFGAPMAAMAAHPAVTTLTAAGAAATSTQAYSPKQTCGGCHFDCATGVYTTVTASFCTNDAARTASMVSRGTITNGTNCNSAGACPDYESMAVTTVTKNQGYINSAGTISYMNYSVTFPNHGASTGHHTSEGRNEELTTAQRTIWGAPSTISSTGMWGRY